MLGIVDSKKYKRVSKWILGFELVCCFVVAYRLPRRFHRLAMTSQTLKNSQATRF